ncbi:MAG TPA: T9SS type A sorting domain-containing protein [Chitinophagales bacterium]
MPSIFSYITFFAFFFVPFYSNAQFAWAIGEGGTGLDVGRNICFDRNNNVILTGYIGGNPIFRGQGYIGNGLSDGFAVKYDENANLLWLRLFGGSGEDKCFGTAVDAEDNIYLCGSFQNSMTVDSFSAQSDGGTDLYILKLNASGDVIWLKTFGGSLDDAALSIGVNERQEVFVCGTFGGAMVFGDDTLTTTSITQSYIGKLNRDGTVQWTKQFYSSGALTANTLTVLLNGTVAVAGYFSENMSIDTLTENVSYPSYEVFLCELNDSGEPLWLQQAGGAYDNLTTKIASDAQDNIVLCGYISGFAQFGNNSLTNAGYNDPFIAKYDTSGNCLWARSGGGTSLDFANGVAFDAQGNVYATGLYENAITFSGHTIFGYDQRQAFMVSYDRNGNFRWLQDIGEAGTECGMGVNVDISGNVYVTGYYTFRAAFGDILLPVASIPQDIFLAKFVQPVSGISESEAEKIAVYPNPAENFITVTGVKIGTEIRITNVLGETIFTAKMQRETLQISVANLASGVYFLNNKLFVKQ